MAETYSLAARREVRLAAGHLGSSQGPILTAPGTVQHLPQGCAGWVRQKAASTSQHQCTHTQTHTVLCYQGCFFTGVFKKLRNARLHPTLSISVAVLQSTILSPRGPPAGHHLLPPAPTEGWSWGHGGQGASEDPGPAARCHQHPGGSRGLPEATEASKGRAEGNGSAATTGMPGETPTEG